MMATAPNQTLGERISNLPRSRRRLAVVAAFLGWPLLIVGYNLLVASGAVPTLAWFPVAIALIVLTFVGVVITYFWARGRVGDTPLDERQREMVTRANVISYGVLATVIVLISGALVIAASFRGPVVVTMEGLTPFLVALGLYLPMLPAAALAWIEPDLDSDVDEPEMGN